MRPKTWDNDFFNVQVWSNNFILIKNPLFYFNNNKKGVLEIIWKITKRGCMFKNNEMTPLSGGKGVANIHYTRGENNIGAPKTT